MKMLDLFSGIGGFSLAASWTGQIETVAFCEIEPYCQKVLHKHWPDVPIYPDIKKLRGESIGPVDIVCGGFPCQPFSCAGKRRGKEDDRYLWPEMFRVIQETKPAWVVGENVAGFVNMGLEDSISDLESERYEVQSIIIPAAGVGAPHRRDRIWIVAWDTKSARIPEIRVIRKGKDPFPIGICKDVENPRCRNSTRDIFSGGHAKQDRKRDANKVERSSGTSLDVFYSTSQRLPDRTSFTLGQSRSIEEPKRSDWWSTEPDVGRVANGIPARLYGGGINEENFNEESRAESHSHNGEMRRVRGVGSENESPSYRLYKAYGGSDPLHEMPCSGTLQSTDYCNMCSMRKRIHSQRPSKKSEDMWPGMPCEVWEDLREQALASYWDREPDIPRVATGIKNRVDRLRGLGNAIVPQVAYQIFKAIVEIEGGTSHV